MTGLRRTGEGYPARLSAERLSAIGPAVGYRPCYRL